ncbi:hypothetical protein WOLCODRAFT_108007 [Wolfiporia cocos MD-104 SS10]|uniref:ARM repeat-containing protein n=1 Tax=Wolfiporia cocos (strain MD-104) TaxID=742152 RepID=A0A2H3J2Q2_WOLCO|nr:hypothetical protein WOLCODRAFT_108007 [Wolfiporia cocos MD-104 SS10]
MEGRSPEEQDRDIRELIRRAERQPVKTSGVRREVLRRLIDLAHSPHPKLKMTAAQNLNKYIKDFPDLEDDAINAVYDLCEDPVTKVRITGYGAIVEVSKEQLKWVKRNADVLVQLLQSDEPEEVPVIKRALSQHLDMDPAVTLGVLCDQVVPSDEPMDEEEQAIRNRLRSLVLSFVTGEAKRSIVERHAVPGSQAEETLVGGMLKAINKLSPPDIDVIVKGVLLSLSSFRPSSSRGKQLLDVIFDRAKASLKIDMPPGGGRSSLENTRYFLEMASFIAVQKRVAHPSHLLQFYFTSLTSKMTLVRLNEDAQVLVLTHIADTLAAFQETSSEGDTAMFPTKQVPDVCAVLLQLFAESMSIERRPWKVCHTLLRTCLHYKQESNWVVPSYLASILQTIQTLAVSQGQDTKMDSLEDIQSLIRSLVPPAPRPPTPSPAPAAATDVSKGTNSIPAAKTERRIMNVKRKHEEQPQPTCPPDSAPSSAANGGDFSTSTPQLNQQQSGKPQARQRASTGAWNAGAKQNGQPAPSEEQPRTAKRAKKGGGEELREPSLLSRMAAAPANSRVGTERATWSSNPKRRIESAPTTFARSAQQPPHDSDRDPIQGFSIKGAAKAAGLGSQSDSQPTKSSLLDRIRDDDVGWDMSGQRKKRRTKT